MDNVQVTVPKATTRRGMIVQAVAQAIEDALPALPPDSAPLRRMEFTFTLEFAENPRRVTIRDMSATVSKLRGITISCDG